MDTNDVGGKAKGGFARAASMSPEQRKTQAAKAAKARWEIPVLQATHGSPDHPLKIGDIEIPCYVLEDGTRVLSQRGVIGGLGMKPGSAVGGADRLRSFLGGKSISPYVSTELTMLINSPIKFKSPLGGGPAFGYPATILADICDVVLEARKAGKILKQQEHIAEQCEILLRGFARVGIIALVDEATGYQKDRAKDELAKILEAFVARELQPWVKTFSVEFYEQLFRLRGLKFPGNSVKRPRYFGHLTNDIIYRRLAPGVWEELKQQTKKNEKGRPKHHLHRRLTPDIGHPKLKDLLTSVTTIMKLSEQWSDFKYKLDRIHPAYNETMLLPFELKDDTGKGI